MLIAGATLAWRAEDAASNATHTTTLPSYVGSLSLVRDSTGQLPKAASANFGGRASVAFVAPVNRGYSGALAAPAAMTVVSVWRLSASSAGHYAMTVGGVVNTGNSCYHDLGNASGQKLAVHADVAIGLPAKMITVNVVTATGVSFYCNSYTAVAAAQAGALAGDTFTIGAITPGGIYTATGEWRTTGYWDRALTNGEVGSLLTALGAREGIAIAP
jgi:hypothetical protein